ncbi:MAG: hypothetical protein CML46_18830 [Rhodobacteraceae bacterium]|nr:hypothetical protein [Paracoccaceae bacterium]
MLEIEYGRKEWLKDPDAAYAEAVRRIRLTRDATDPEDRKTIWYNDLGALRAIPPGLGEVEGLEALEVGDGETPDGNFNEPHQRIESLAPLAEAPDLRRLNLYDTGVTDLLPLARLPRLRVLDLGINPQVADIAPLAGCTGLQSLDLGHTQVADIAPLAGCTGLQSLNLDSTQVADIAPLAGCTGLQSLGLRGTQVADIAPLAGCTGLKSLDLETTQVADIAPLLRIGRFPAGGGEHLLVFGTPAARSDPVLEAISKKNQDVQAREVIDWLRGETRREAESRIRRASDIAVILSDDLMIAIDRLGPEGAARKGREAVAARMEGLRITAADLARDAGQTDLAGFPPRDVAEALRLYAERTATASPLYYALLGPAATIRATLEAGEHDPILRQMKSGFLARLRLLVEQHDEIAPWFRPVEEIADELARLLPPLRKDADVSGVAEDAEILAEDAGRLVAEGAADATLKIGAEAVAAEAREALKSGDRALMARAAANLLSLAAGIRDKLASLRDAVNDAASRPVESMGKALIIQQFLSIPFVQSLNQWLATLPLKIVELFEAGATAATALPTTIPI